MGKQLLLYGRIVPVTRENHGDRSLKTGTDYTFARGVNSVPLMVAEFENAASEYPIVFTEAGSDILPAVILGLTEDDNLYLTETGNWTAKYIPAFVRRYPFIFAKNEDEELLTLCIDEEFGGLNRDGRGERLFDSEGEQTQYLKNVLNFLQDYERQFQITRIFCRQVKELDLLEPMRATISLPGGESRSLTGFSGINREKLQKLPGDRLETLMRSGYLDLLYSHLHSLRNFASLSERGAAAISGDPSPETL